MIGNIKLASYHFATSMPYQANILLSIKIKAQKVAQVNYRDVELPSYLIGGIFTRIFLKDQKAIQVSYKLAPLQNIHENIPKRLEDSSSRLQIEYPTKYSWEYFKKTRRQFKSVMNRVPYEIFIGIFSKNHKIIQVSYEPTTLWNICRNIPKRSKGSLVNYTLTPLQNIYENILKRL